MARIAEFPNERRSHVHVELELVRASEPIEGRVTVASEPPLQFTGWLALSLVLESAIVGPPR